MILPPVDGAGALRVLGIGRDLPAQPDEAFGPWLWRRCTSESDGLAALEDDTELPWQAVVIDADALPMLLVDWPGLAKAVRSAAVVVLADAPTREQAWAWLGAGVQDVLDARRCDGAELSRAVALSVRRWQAQEDVRRAWSIDLDTGLPNRMQLMELMHQLFALREREPAPMALLVLRVGGLRGVDAQLGVGAAATLRRKLAVRLRAALRASDVVAALDGDDFAVLLTRLDAQEDAEKVVVKLSRALQAPLSFAGQPRRVSVSSGVALHPLHSQRPEDLLAFALAGAQQAMVDTGVWTGSPLGGAAANDPE